MRSKSTPRADTSHPDVYTPFAAATERVPNFAASGLIIRSQGPSAPDPETRRLPRAIASLPGVADRHLNLAKQLERQLARFTDAGQADATVAESARTLWRAAVSDVQNGLDDDRPLYWGRLALRRSVYRSALREKDSLLRSIEHYSRGMGDLRLGDDVLNVLITGFDPFHLETRLDQSNPSGLAALALNGSEFGSGGGRARVCASIFPVRFEDFDDGIVERFFQQILAEREPAMVVTLSMGRDAFDLERFPGRRRSAQDPDNHNVLTGASPDKPLPPGKTGSHLEGPEFLEFSLPVHAMRAADGHWPVRDNRWVTTIERGEFEAGSLADLQSQLAVRGSGGGYLSNEIAYRSRLLHGQLGCSCPIGHVHTPAIQGHNAALERLMVGQIRQMLAQAAASLTPRPPS